MTSHPIVPELTTVTDTSTAVICGVVPVGELANFFDRSFTTLATVVASQNVAITGPAYALYRDVPSDTADLEVGFPTSSRSIRPMASRPARFPAGRVARAIHQGGYDQLGSSWGQLEQWIRPGSRADGSVLGGTSPSRGPTWILTSCAPELNWPVTGLTPPT